MPTQSDAYSDSQVTTASEHYDALLNGFTDIMRLYDDQDSIRLQDWFNLIESHEEQTGMLLLSPQQKHELAPFCIANADLELTPEDVVSLLKLAAQQRPLEETQDMFAQRRRTSKLLGTASSTLGQRRRKESEQLGTLISESETEDSLFRESTGPSNPEDSNKIDRTPSESESMAIESYHRQNEVLSRRLIEREQELKQLEEEQEERINFISKQAEELEREITARKKEVQDYKAREQLATQQIQELESQVTGLEHEQHLHRRDQALTKTQLEEMAEELAKLKDAVQSKESKLVQDLAERENTQKALQTLMQEKDSLEQVQQELEKQLEESKDAFEQVYKVQTENENLKEMLEQMKQEMDQIEAVNQLQIELPKQQNTLLAELKTQHLDGGDSGNGRESLDNRSDQTACLKKQLVIQATIVDQLKSKVLAFKSKIDADHGEKRLKWTWQHVLVGILIYMLLVASAVKWLSTDTTSIAYPLVIRSWLPDKLRYDIEQYVYGDISTPT
ncbi:hypothetical protein INT43_006186 [Umbelopsis isabellina]|uniref:Uncharacterized protein n=1 Tax=Mortierella isabellina TaxID=91625 RepID=A0A8H7PZV1_MORIS|nr:hypothetical protein INT43_006186 [Umbelopsis isabellina]